MNLSAFTGRLKNIAGSDAGRRLIVFLGVAGILLIFLSDYLPHGNTDPPKTDSAAQSATDEYKTSLERQVSELVGSIDGVGRARVMITLSNGIEYVYASQEQKSSDVSQNTDNGSSVRTQSSDNSQQTIILVDSGNGKQALVQTEIMPSVKGVVVVCDGGDDPDVEELVLNAVTTALNISKRRVCVTKLSA